MYHPDGRFGRLVDDPDSRSNPVAAYTDNAEPVRSLDQIRHYVDLLLHAITDHHGPPWERDEALWRVQELAEELAVDQPSGPRVKSRWIRLAPLVQSLLPDVSVPTISRLIDDVL